MKANQQQPLMQFINSQNQTVSYSVPKKPQYFPSQNTTAIQPHLQNNTHSDNRKHQGQPIQQQQHPSNMMPQGNFNIKNPQYQQSFNQQLSAANAHAKPAAPSTKLPNHNNNKANMKISHQQQQQVQQHNNSYIQLPQHPQTQNVSSSIQLPQQYQFQTPTQQQQVIYKKSPYKEKRRTRKEYIITCRILEAKLLVSLTNFFAMNVHCKLMFKEEIKITSSQTGKNPKWNDSFVFEIQDEKKTQVLEIDVYHKQFMRSEEKIGSTLLNFGTSNYKVTDWFFLSNDKHEQVGSILVYLTIEEKRKKRLSGSVQGVKEPNGKLPLLEGENLDDDQEDEFQHSIDFRDHEISRSVAANTKKKKYLGVKGEKKLIQNQMVGVPGVPQYAGLQTQQMMQNGNQYLNTLLNQPRQSVTENSVIQMVSSHSSNNSIDDGQGEDSGNKQQNLNYNVKQFHQAQNIQQNQKMNNLVSAMDEEGLGHLVPQQMMYGSNGSNQQQFYNQQNKNSQSQLLAIEDLQANFGEGGIGINQSHHQIQKTHSHTHKHRHKKRNHRKDKLVGVQNQSNLDQEGLRIRKPSHKHKKKNRGEYNEQEEIIGMPEEYQMDGLMNQADAQRDFEDHGINHHEMEDELNYGLYLNQRSHQQLFPQGQPNQAISSSQSQQMLQAINKVNIGFESGGGNSSGSGGGAQHFFNGNFNMGGGSNGSQIPGPSYYDDQHSIESVNNVDHLNHNMMNPTQGELGMPQEIEQIRMVLNEENYRIKSQDSWVAKMFEKLKYDNKKIMHDKEEIKKENKKIMYEKEEIKKTKEQLKQANKKLDHAKEEIEYQRQQIERQYLALKQEKNKRNQEAKLMEEMLKTFSELVYKGRLIQSANSQGYSIQKLDEFTMMMKSIHQMLQLLIASNSSSIYQNQQVLAMNQLQSKPPIFRPEEAKSVNEHNSSKMQLSHMQQDSTSSCGEQEMEKQGRGGSVHQNLNQSQINNMKNINSKLVDNSNVQQQMKNPKVPKQQISNNQKFQQSGSPPRVITDILNTDEDEDFIGGGDPIDAAHLDSIKGNLFSDSQDYSKLQQQLHQQQQNTKYNNYFHHGKYGQIPGQGVMLNGPQNHLNMNSNNQQYFVDGIHSNIGSNGITDDEASYENGNTALIKQMKANMYLKGGVGIGMLNNEQHELSTIMEKKIASQRRSSYGEGGADQIMLDNQQRNAAELQKLAGIPQNVYTNIEEQKTVKNSSDKQVKEIEKAWEVIQQKEEKLEVLNDLIEQQRKQNDKERKEIEEKKKQMEQMLQSMSSQYDMFMNQRKQEKAKVQEPLYQSQKSPKALHKVESQKQQKAHQVQDIGNEQKQVFKNRFPEQDIHQQQLEPNDFDSEQDSMDDYEINQYMQSNLTKNHGIMLEIQKEKGITDQLLIERELLKKLAKENQIYKDPQSIVVVTASEMNSQNSNKNHPNNQPQFYQQEVSGFEKRMQMTNIRQQEEQKKEDFDQYGNHNGLEVKEEEDQEDDSMDFKPDPDFLKKINSRMRDNDQIVDKQKGNAFYETNFEEHKQSRGLFYASDDSSDSEESVARVQQPIPQSEMHLNIQNVQSERQHSSDEGEMGNMELNDPARYFIPQRNQDDENVEVIEELEDYPEGMNINQTSQGQGGRETIYNVDGFNLDEEPVIIPNDEIDSLACVDIAEPYDESIGTPQQDLDQSQQDMGTIKREDISQYQQQMAMASAFEEEKVQNPFEKNQNDNSLSPKKKGKKQEKLPEEEILRLINEKYQLEESTKDVSVIYKDNKIFDQPKKALYGIQKVVNEQ